METTENSFRPLEPQEMEYHEYLDYWFCACGNFEKEEGFMACTAQGNLISPIRAEYGRCERCGRIFHIESHTIMGINPNPNRGRF